MKSPTGNVTDVKDVKQKITDVAKSNFVGSIRICNWSSDVHCPYRYLESMDNHSANNSAGGSYHEICDICSCQFVKSSRTVGTYLGLFFKVSPHGIFLNPSHQLVQS